MEKVNKIIGKAIITENTGEKLDIVIEDLIIEGNRLLGFVVKKIGWNKNGFILPLNKVVKIEKNHVFTYSQKEIKAIKEDSSLKASLNKGCFPLFQSQKILKKSGKKLGKIVDICFDVKTGKIKTYQVSFVNLTNASETVFIPATETEVTVEDALRVNFNISDQINNSEINYQKQHDLSAMSASNLSQQEGLVAEKNQGEKVNILDKIYQIGGDNYKKNEKLMERENTNNSREKERLTTVGLSSVIKNSLNKENHYQRRKESPNKANINQQEKKIRWALGRPVVRVILDRQNNVILNVGDLINYQAVARAKQAGVLDVLLSSVYYKK